VHRFASLRDSFQSEIRNLQSDIRNHQIVKSSNHHIITSSHPKSEIRNQKILCVSLRHFDWFDESSPTKAQCTALRLCVILFNPKSEICNPKS
jgi:hypothetical protein